MAGLDRWAGLGPKEWVKTQRVELARLNAIRQAKGYIPENDFRITGDLLHRCEDTLRRMVDAEYGPPTPRAPGFVVTDWWMDLLFAHKDNVARLYRDAVATGLSMPSYTTVNRAFKDANPVKRKFARHGAKGYRKSLIYLTWEAESRNDIWQADTCELDIFVLSKNGKTSSKPHLITFLDDRDRVITGWGATFHPPTAADVAAVFAEAMLAKPHGDHWYGGVPNEVLWDNGGAFKAEELTTLAMKVGSDVHAVKRYTPTKKGKVEKWFRDFQEGILEILPGSTTSPESWTRKDPYRPSVYHGPLSDLLTQEEFVALVGNSIRERTFMERPMKGGPTQYEAWCRDPNPLVEVPREVVRDHLHKLENHKIGKQGIELNGKFYVPIGSALDANPRLRVGEEVVVRTLLSSAPWLEVFDLKGGWIDTFKPSDEFNADEIGQREDERITMYHEASGHARRAGEIRRDRARQIDESGAMPSLASVALAAVSEPVASAEPPAASRPAQVEGQLFTLPRADHEAVVVAARKKPIKSSARTRSVRPAAPVLTLLNMEEPA